MSCWKFPAPLDTKGQGVLVRAACEAVDFLPFLLREGWAERACGRAAGGVPGRRAMPGTERGRGWGSCWHGCGRPEASHPTDRRVWRGPCRGSRLSCYWAGARRKVVEATSSFKMVAVGIRQVFTAPAAEGSAQVTRASLSAPCP